MQAWIAMAFGDADSPYADEPSTVYAYDDQVQNHKQVQIGHLLFLRDRSRLEGIGRIQSIDEAPGQKIYRRCPECGTGRIHKRTTIEPPYKCDAGHEFSSPHELLEPVTTYKASFASAWLAVRSNITVMELRPFELRDSKQLAIMPADAGGLASYVARRCPEIAARLIGWIGGGLDALDDTKGNENVVLTPPGTDERDLIARAIRLRRGQSAFRNELINRYGGRCVLSGCNVLGVLEAAHIRPYRGPRDNDPRNGLLLRSDLHTLFDLNRIGVEPHHLTAMAHTSLRQSEYQVIHGKPLLIPAGMAPDKSALLTRWQEFVSNDAMKAASPMKDDKPR
jgi:putative restriction endonuclease